jgi:hypothetical protein
LEDLGLSSTAVLDKSFNVHNFGVLNMAANNPGRRLAFECSLSGSTSLSRHARQFSSGQQSPLGVPGLTGSISTSPTSPTSGIPNIDADWFDAFISPSTAPNDDPACMAVDNFQFPSWEQLPTEFQNPTTSVGFKSTIPLGTTGISSPGLMESTVGTSQTWDDNELSFEMDLDFDTEMLASGIAK